MIEEDAQFPLKSRTFRLQNSNLIAAAGRAMRSNMVRYRIGWAIAHSTVLVALCACSRLGAAAPSPEDLLKSHGLRLVGSLYILEIETDVQKKVTDIRQAARKVKLAQTRQRGTGSREQYQRAIEEFEDQIKNYQSEIQSVNVQMSQVPASYGVGRFANVYRNQVYSQLLGYRNQLQMEMSQARASLNQLKNEPFDEKAKEKVDALLRDERDNYDQALADLRKLVESASHDYAELQNDSSVKKALATLAKTAKVKPKLGPSPHYLTNVKLLEKLEKDKAAGTAGDAFDDSPKTDRRSTRARRGSAKSADSTKPADSAKPTDSAKRADSEKDD
jgi:tetratricopeptide (TPR) repeat protein